MNGAACRASGQATTNPASDGLGNPDRSQQGREQQDQRKLGANGETGHECRQREAVRTALVDGADHEIERQRDGGEHGHVAFEIMGVLDGKRREGHERGGRQRGGARAGGAARQQRGQPDGQRAEQDVEGVAERENVQARGVVAVGEVQEIFGAFQRLHHRPFHRLARGVGQHEEPAGIAVGAQGMRFVHPVHPARDEPLVGVEIEPFRKACAAQQQAGGQARQQQQGERVFADFHG